MKQAMQWEEAKLILSGKAFYGPTPDIANQNASRFVLLLFASFIHSA